jgi:hypothetical protein
MTEYYIGSVASNLPTVVALTAATVKTTIQVATPSTTDIKLVGWGLSFDGAAGGTQVPVVCVLYDDSTGATVTSATPINWGNSQAQASLCVGGTAATGVNASAEGTITAPRYLDMQEVSPQTGYGVFWPPAHQPRVGQSRFLRIRCTAPASVNVLPWILWAEPAV